ncbi:unnamed protein product, partial [Ranitomeya imitator]
MSPDLIPIEWEKIPAEKCKKLIDGYKKCLEAVINAKRQKSARLWTVLEIRDGQEDYDRLRPLSYQDVNLVLICFDVTNPTSFDNVLIKWYPEVHHFCRGVPVVLIGCKTDLRMDKERLRKLKTSQQEPITYFQ